MSRAMIQYALENKTCFITGATGMIGSRLVSYIHEVAPEWHVIALVRSLERAQAGLGQYDWLTYVQGDVTQPLAYKGDIDYGEAYNIANERPIALSMRWL